MINKTIKNIVAIIMLALIFLTNILNIVYGVTEISEAYLENKGDCGLHLQYWNEERQVWSYIKCTYVAFTENEKEHPAYCLNREVGGVGEYDNYTVDISSLIDDDRIWRVIKNGYPYQAPEQIGVENEYDAFVATKQAVYCIIYDFDAPSRYRGGDYRGEQIANAIVNLVNEGRYGTDTPYSAGINTEKIGDFAKEGDFYIQEFKVNCGIEVSEYRITVTNGMPEGTIITDTNGNERITFYGTENFKIKIPKAKIKDDIDITFSIQAKARSYPIFYGRTRIENTQDYAVTFDAIGDVVGAGNLNVKTNNGRIQVNKTDEDTKKPISGVTFQLTKEDGTVVANATTNEKGIATFNDLYSGNYKLKEISTTKKYVLNSKEFNVNVEYNETTIKDVTNELKKGQLEITKIDSKTKEKLEGVIFGIYDENNKEIEKIVTDKNGIAKTKPLPYGKYYTKEIETGSSNYLLNEKVYNFEITKNNEIVQVTIENEKIEKKETKEIKPEEKQEKKLPKTGE